MYLKQWLLIRLDATGFVLAQLPASASRDPLAELPIDNHDCSTGMGKKKRKNVEA